MQLAKACGLGLLSIAIMTLTFKWPELMPPDLFIPCVVAFSMAVLLINRFLINRFLEDKIVVLLKALGLALFVVGLIMVLEPPGEAVIPQHLHEALFGCLLAVFALAVVRCLVVHLLFNVLLRRRFRRQVLLIGMNQDAERITDLIIRQKAPFWVAGTVSPSSKRPTARHGY